jgi:hypothetical protein
MMTLKDDRMDTKDVAEQIAELIKHVGLTVGHYGSFVTVYFEGSDQLFSVHITEIFKHGD